MTYYTSDYLAIEAGNGFIFVNWLTAPTSVEFRNGMDKLFETIRQTKTGKVVTDTRNLGAISTEDQTWSNTDWLSKAVGAGYNQIAIVISPDIFTQMSVEDIMSQVQGLKIGYFDTVEKAAEWIDGK